MSTMAEIFRKSVHDSLDEVEQTSTVEAFYSHFELIKYLVVASQPWLPEVYFTDRFIYGLRYDVQPYVIKFQPVTVKDAYHLACIYEYSLYRQYFPESKKKKDDIYLRNSVKETHMSVPSRDKAYGVVVVEEFSSVSLSVSDNIVSSSVVETAVDSLDESSEIVSDTVEEQVFAGHDILVPIAAVKEQQQSIIAHEVISMGFPLDLIQLPVIRDVIAAEEPTGTSSGPKTTYNNELALPMLTPKEPKMHPPDDTPVLGTSSSYSWLNHKSQSLLLLHMGLYTARRFYNMEVFLPTTGTFTHNLWKIAWNDMMGFTTRNFYNVLSMPLRIHNASAYIVSYVPSGDTLSTKKRFGITTTMGRDSHSSTLSTTAEIQFCASVGGFVSSGGTLWHIAWGVLTATLQPLVVLRVSTAEHAVQFQQFYLSHRFFCEELLWLMYATCPVIVPNSGVIYKGCTGCFDPGVITSLLCAPRARYFPLLKQHESMLLQATHVIGSTGSTLGDKVKKGLLLRVYASKFGLVIGTGLVTYVETTNRDKYGFVSYSFLKVFICYCHLTMYSGYPTYYDIRHNFRFHLYWEWIAHTLIVVAGMVGINLFALSNVRVQSLSERIGSTPGCPYVVVPVVDDQGPLWVCSKVRGLAKELSTQISVAAKRHTKQVHLAIQHMIRVQFLQWQHSLPKRLSFCTDLLACFDPGGEFGTLLALALLQYRPLAGSASVEIHDTKVDVEVTTVSGHSVSYNGVDIISAAGYYSAVLDVQFSSTHHKYFPSIMKLHIEDFSAILCIPVCVSTIPAAGQIMGGTGPDSENIVLAFAYGLKWEANITTAHDILLFTVCFTLSPSHHNVLVQMCKFKGASSLLVTSWNFMVLIWLLAWSLTQLGCVLKVVSTDSCVFLFLPPYRHTILTTQEERPLFFLMFNGDEGKFAIETTLSRILSRLISFADAILCGFGQKMKSVGSESILGRSSLFLGSHSIEYGKRFTMDVSADTLRKVVIAQTAFAGIHRLHFSNDQDIKFFELGVIGTWHGRMSRQQDEHFATDKMCVGAVKLILAFQILVSLQGWPIPAPGNLHVGYMALVLTAVVLDTDTSSGVLTNYLYNMDIPSPSLPSISVDGSATAIPQLVAGSNRKLRSATSNTGTTQLLLLIKWTAATDSMTTWCERTSFYNAYHATAPLQTKLGTTSACPIGSLSGTATRSESLLKQATPNPPLLAVSPPLAHHSLASAVSIPSIISYNPIAQPPTIMQSSTDTPFSQTHTSGAVVPPNRPLQVHQGHNGTQTIPLTYVHQYLPTMPLPHQAPILPEHVAMLTTVSTNSELQPHHEDMV